MEGALTPSTKYAAIDGDNFFFFLSCFLFSFCDSSFLFYIIFIFSSKFFFLFSSLGGTCYGQGNECILPPCMQSQIPQSTTYCIQTKRTRINAPF